MKFSEDMVSAFASSTFDYARKRREDYAIVPEMLLVCESVKNVPLSESLGRGMFYFSDIVVSGEDVSFDHSQRDNGFDVHAIRASQVKSDIFLSKDRKHSFVDTSRISCQWSVHGVQSSQSTFFPERLREFYEATSFDEPIASSLYAVALSHAVLQNHVRRLDRDDISQNLSDALVGNQKSLTYSSIRFDFPNGMRQISGNELYYGVMVKAEPRNVYRANFICSDGAFGHLAKVESRFRMTPQDIIRKKVRSLTATHVV